MKIAPLWCEGIVSESGPHKKSCLCKIRRVILRAPAGKEMHAFPSEERYSAKDLREVTMNFFQKKVKNFNGRKRAGQKSPSAKNGQKLDKNIFIH